MTEEKSSNGKITKEMPIGKIVADHPETFDVFMKYGMHCVGCAAARFENLEQGCSAHGIDADAMVVDLNKALEDAKEGKKTEEE